MRIRPRIAKIDDRIAEQKEHGQLEVDGARIHFQFHRLGAEVAEAPQCLQ